MLKRRRRRLSRSIFNRSQSSQSRRVLQSEPLEVRCLLAGDPIKINFQTGDTINTTTHPELSGYVADSGQAYGSRGNGLTYGWLDGSLTPDAQDEARDRNNDAAPDERYDTLNHMIKGDDHSWQIELPAGVYDVHIVAGDASFTNQVHDLMLLSGDTSLNLDDPDGEDNWDEFHVSDFQVTNGTLRISPNATGDNQKLAFLEITPKSQITAPQVSAVFPVNVRSLSAQLTGRVLDTGNEAPDVTIFYGTTDGGTDAAAWSDSQHAGKHDDLFNFLLEGLDSSTSYYVRGFVSNSAGGNWSPQSFAFTTSPLELAEVEANLASDVTATQATAHGRVTSTGGQAPEVTLYWGTSDAGTVAANWPNQRSLGTQSSQFQTMLDSLQDGTAYQYRFAATNAAGTVWTGVSSFTTLEVSAPLAINRPAIDIDGFAATIGGTVTSTGNDEPEVTIYWGESDGGTNQAAWQNSAALGRQPDDFAWTVAGLDFDTVYYYRAFVENAAGGTWTPDSASFRTENVTAPIVENVAARSISSSQATVGGNIVDFGNDGPLVRLYYGTSDGGTNPAQWDQWIEFAEEFGSYDTTLTNLSAETDYYFRSLATNAAGSTWATSTATFSTPAAPALLLTELLASNENGLTTSTRSSAAASFGDTVAPDWIEIFNPTSQVADLSGLHLTDDAEDRTKWSFPEGVTIGPRSYLVVFASGDDILDPNLDQRGFLHTNFRLSTDGEYLGLTDSGGEVIHEYANGYPAQRTDISFGYDAAGDPHYYATATPGFTNSQAEVNLVRDTTFSVDRGFFTEPFSVDVTTKTPGATLVYTTDGSIPTLDNGTRVDAASDDVSPVASVLIEGTTTLRAAAFKTGYDATDVDTQTYLFLDNVLQQSESYGSNGNGLPSFASWGHSNKTGDWQVDPDIVNHADADNRLTADDLKAVPTLSLTLPWEDMFASRTGIYISGTGSPRAVSIEQILGDGTTGFQIDGSVQIQGGSSTNRWKADKLSMRLKFTEEFGPTKLENPVFGPGTSDRLDTLVLDAVLNFGWHHPSTGQTGSAKFIQDQFVANLQNAMGGYAPHARYHHLYINGLYWGMYYVHERPDASFAADYLGGDKEDYDVMKHNQNTAVDGTRDNFRDMLSLARRDLSDASNYEALAEVLDIQDFARYTLVNIYAGNTDWAHHNWYASFNRESSDGRWRFHSWDAEHVLKSATEDVTSRNDSGSPTEIHQRLLASDEYRMIFADLVQEHMFHDGVLTPDNAAAEYQALMDEIDRAIVGESARWGDNRVSRPYTRDNWLRTQNSLLNNYFPRRTDRVLQQLRSDGLYPSTSVSTPEFQVNNVSQHGGYISSSDQVSLAGSGGTIYYTIDGSDPRLAGGAVAPSAQVYSGPFQLSESTILRTRLRTSNGSWSAVSTTTFYPFAAPSADNLAISEINYNPHESLRQFGERTVDSDEFEFLELANTGDETIELAGVRLEQRTVGNHLEGVSFTFPFKTLAPGERVVVVANEGAFASRYGDNVNLAGEYRGNLADGGEQLTVLNGEGGLIQQFRFNDSGNWPGRADGSGSSLEVIDLRGDYSKPSNYRNSVEFGGTPGTAGTGTAPEVLINEILTHTDLPQVDTIELYNASNAPIDLANWYLSDSRDDLFSFRISGDDTVIQPNGYRVFDEVELGFGFRGQESDDAWLVEADASGRPLRFVDRVEFGATQNGQSLGRWPNGGGRLFPMTELTMGGPNASPVTPSVVISEVHYHPVADTEQPDANAIDASDFEFIELTNPSNTPIAIEHWRLDRAVEYDFPVGFALEAQESIVVVSFDPVTDEALATSFKARYNLDDTVRIVGPYDGKLDNDGETIELERPEDLRQVGLGYVLVDRVGYDDRAPWPLAADGLGSSLQRTATNAYGDFPASWNVAAPSPGQADLGLEPTDATDLNGDGLSNVADIDLLCQSIRGQSAPLDLNNDSVVDTSDLDHWLTQFGSSRGDVNLDRVFNSSDLIAVFAAGQYEDGVPANSTWAGGDWNCDGEFDTGDLVAAFASGAYTSAAVPSAAHRLSASSLMKTSDLAAARDAQDRRPGVAGSKAEKQRDIEIETSDTQAKQTDRAIEQLTFENLF